MRQVPFGRGVAGWTKSILEKRGYPRYMFRIPLLHIDGYRVTSMRSFKDYCKGGNFYEKN